ncbi:MAG: hypothetical protein ACRENQ_05780 [Gemmatimonadaceae bacterium]
MGASRPRLAARAALEHLAPGAYLALTSARARRHSQRMFARWGCLDLNHALVAQLGHDVVDGPFAGLRLSPLALRDHIGPYLLGTYEHELHTTWRAFEHTRFSAIVDVGSRFGFYAVGLARRHPRTPVTAVDPDHWARAATRQMAAANATPQVRTTRRMTAERLASMLPEDALVVSDCEGYERTLFCGKRIPALRSATMVIEVHDAVAPGVGKAIAYRFSASHDVQRIASETSPPVPTADLEFLDDRQRRLAVNELRLSQDWLVLRPRRL